jgi:carbamoyltransferase
MMPGWLRHKLHIPRIIRRELAYDGLVLHDSHHRSHAASAFFPSPFERAAIVTLDGVGEWAAGSIGVGQGREVRILEEMNFPHSLGLLYSAFTQFTGFKVNSGEYKMMGLAPYGEPRFAQTILEHVVDLKPDGSVELNLELFAFLAQPTMTNEAFARLFGGPARKPDARITRREMDIARSIQEVTEEAVLRTARHAHAITGEKRLCMAGGVALNCVANGQLLRKGPFEDLWIQPAAGDAGCALGAALDAYHLYFGKPRTLLESGRPRQGGSTLGPSFSDDEIRAFLETHGVPHHRLDEAGRADAIAAELESGKVVGHLQGRLEFGPRSLGARSILGDARNREMQVNLNLKIKYRESFRPFAPSVLAERARDYFDLDRESPYMLLVSPVKTSRRLPIAPVDPSGDDLLEVVRRPRSDVPAITHVDYSARVQTVTREDHPGYHALIEAFERRTGCAVVVNTSFNVRGEPIVCTPQDAFRCFMRTEMDVLVLGNTLVRKSEQAPWPEPKGHIEEDEPEPEPTSAPVADDAFQASLGHVFDTQMLPAIGRARAEEIRVSTEFRRVPSTWTAAAANLSDRSVFVLPPALDGLRRDPALMAAAIATYWAKTPLSEDLRRMLETLLKLAESFPEPDARGFEEKVSHAMYVMY